MKINKINTAQMNTTNSNSIESTTTPQEDCSARSIHICEQISPPLAHRVVMQLLQYEAEKPHTPIHMYIFSPGGCIPSGLAIVDAMLHISSPVFTYTIGYAASMGAVILAAGEQGHRYILPHSRVMIHQASSNLGGTIENVRATLAHHCELASETESLLARFTKRSTEEIKQASTVDNWLPAPAAVEFGLVDFILDSYSK